MDSLKISVIIPVYNVERYLQRCVDSVLNQTYKNLEVILVDDGSSDGCPAICDEYVRRDKRVIVLHKKNGGLSSARNAALDSTLTGDFVTFIDSDDWIAPNYYEYCISKLTNNEADVIQVDYTYATDKKIDKRNPTEKIQVYEGKAILQHYLETTTYTGSYSVCRCLFSMELIKDNRFREGKINEDIDWKYKVLSNSRKLVVSNQVMYFYYQSGNTISTGGLKKRDFQLREAAELLRDLTSNEKYGSIRELGEVKEARTAFSLLSKIAYFGISDTSLDKKQVVKELTEEHRNNYRKLLNAPLPFSRKVLSVMFAVNYNLTEAAIHLFKKIIG
jgi:glycosyltransferase involved in cell wall biosynthesis